MKLWKLFVAFFILASLSGLSHFHFKLTRAEVQQYEDSQKQFADATERHDQIRMKLLETAEGREYVTTGQEMETLRSEMYKADTIRIFPRIISAVFCGVSIMMMFVIIVVKVTIKKPALPPWKPRPTGR